MTSKIISMILKAVEKFLDRVIIIRREYEENLMGRGFHSMRFRSSMEKIVVLGKDSEENKEKIDKVARMLTKTCENQVNQDIEARKAKIKKKKKGK